MYKTIMEIIEKYKGKRIAVVSHSIAISFFLGKWCRINYNDKFMFNNKEFFDGEWSYCQTFKLTFNENNLTDVEII